MTRVFIETFGCSANQNDSEIMAGILSRSGLLVVDNRDLAQITVVNTCVVKGQTEAQMVRLLKTLAGKKVIVAGCMPEVELDIIESILPDASIVSTHHVQDIAKAVKALLEGNRLVLVGPSGIEKVGLTRVQHNPTVGIIQINEGCTGGCAYCIVKQVKPHLRSYSERLILKGASQSLDAGCKELWITSQDTAAYGIDRKGKSELPVLLAKLTKLPGKFFIRIGMMNPDNVLPVLDELIDSFDSDKVFKFIHLPVQAGSDKVLKEMNRKYSSVEFERVVDAFRSRFPKMTIATDIICGFPGESEEEFAETLRLMERVRPTVMNISRYTERPGTQAAKKKATHGNITKERSRKVTELFRRIAAEHNAEMVGWEGEIIIDDKGKGNSSVGHNEFYQVVVVNEKIPIGKRIKVKITGSTIHHLRAIVR